MTAVKHRLRDAWCGIATKAKVGKNNNNGAQLGFARGECARARVLLRFSLLLGRFGDDAQSAVNVFLH